MTTLENTETKPVSAMIAGDMNFAVAIYPTHHEAEEAVKELDAGGFDMTKISIAGRDYQTDEQVLGYYNTGDRIKAWGKRGAFWGGLWGCMFGASFVVPGIGPIVAAGPLVAWIVGALEGAVAVGGLSALGAALFSTGIPKHSVLKYESDIQAGRFVLIANGSPAEAAEAKSMLDITNHIGLNEHYS